MRLAYNTNGLTNHRLDDALVLLHEAGYQGVALTLDHHHHDPFAPDLEGRTRALKTRLDDLGLGLVVETGARFLLDPRHKHEPTLVSPTAEERGRRVEFLKRAVDVAAVGEAETVSFWAGVPRPEVTALGEPTIRSYLLEGLHEVLEYAAAHGVVVSMEPEPGMSVETVDDFFRIRDALGAVGTRLHLALDVGHCLVTGDRAPEAAVVECAELLGTVSIEDMARGVHVHLPFGEGDVDLPAVVRALQAVCWNGLVCVELSRDAHRGHTMVRTAIDWLRTHTPVHPPRAD